MLPPPFLALDSLRAMDAQSPELLACEAASATLFRLLPLLLAGAEAYQQQELPLEVFIFHVSLQVKQQQQQLQQKQHAATAAVVYVAAVDSAAAAAAA